MTDYPPHEASLAALRSAGSLVFICTGNMIRSPFAELHARRLGCDLPLRSAATTYRNPCIHPEAGAELVRRGVDPAQVDAFRPTHLDELAVDPTAPLEGALFLGMTEEHMDALAVHPASVGHARLLGEFGLGGCEIADPLHDGNYPRAFGLIATCVEVIVRSLEGQR